jgi:hypothetical protein
MKAHSSSHLTFIWSLRSALAIAALATTACGSGDDSTPAPAEAGLDSTTTVPDAGTSETSVDAGAGEAEAAAAPLSFATDIFPIVAAHCIACHGVGTTADGGTGGGVNLGHLDMGDAAAAYGNLLGDGGGVLAEGTLAGLFDGGVTCADVAADSGLKRVVPNDVPHSLFCNKVASKEDGGPAVACGNPMPLGTTTPLDPALVTTIKAWINSGANP